jgi:hypothetical protein
MSAGDSTHFREDLLKIGVFKAFAVRSGVEKVKDSGIVALI